MEVQQLEDLAPDAPATYFIQSTNGGPIKIGRVRRAGTLLSRLGTLQTAHAYPLRVVGVIAGDLEQYLHLRFAKWRLSGEWFMDAAELRSFIGLQPGGAPSTPFGWDLGYKAGYDEGEVAGWDQATAVVRRALHLDDEDEDRILAAAGGV